MPSLTWKEVEKELRGKFRQTSTQIAWLIGVRETLRNLASSGISTSPDFTLHNEIHSDNIVLLLSRLAGYLTEPLSEYEAYLLIASAYLHDVGMFFSEEQFDEEIINDVAKALSFCPNDLCDCSSNYETVATKPIGFQIRAMHHLLSAYLIDEEGVIIGKNLSSAAIELELQKRIKK